eukprot:CAMPEP_0170189180 /NCGR_PEP_ID=MMETSP0040_2-20121228/46199_1 /TAXON_ID=641309 /ORGANISM="Lotharella oceanica, Strain CCMP622" /LENGTH=502 /DNA_ID=CAMNT_0010436669 /DNA_START=39 /DNA_END=1547 /DNA_ORIENTATION=-
MADKKGEGGSGHRDGVLSQLPKELTQYLVFPDPKAHLRISSQASCLDRICCCLCLPYALCCKMVLIRQGQIGLTWHGDEPRIIGPGRHYLMSPTHSLFAIRDISDPVIIHGPIKIIRVRVGELGFGIDTENGNPVLLTAGKHVITSPTFKFNSMLDLTLRTNELGVMKLVRVETGCVGYAYKRGELVILQPGIHVIVPPDRFGSILSTQQQTLTLPEGVHESSDYVPLKIRADVFYRIVNPKKALTNIRDVENQIRETAVSTLAGIIRSSTLNEIANSSKVTYSKPSDSKSGGEEPSAPPFFKHVHDQFLAELHDHMFDDWGIELHNIRIESLKINDARLAQDISKQAVQVSQQEAKYRMLQKQAEVIQVEANNKKTQTLKDMEARTECIRSKADADAAAKLKEAEANNTIILKRAQAEAKAMVERARAEKEAKELLGQGEAKYAEFLAKTALGSDLAKLRVQADMMSGLNQVAYVPHLPQILKQTTFTTPLADPLAEGKSS